MEQLRLNALMYVKYNLRHELRQMEMEEKGDNHSICLSNLDSDDG